MSTAPTYPAKTLGKLFNLTERRIQQLAKEGVLPKAERGKYDLIECTRAYIKYLQDRAFGKDAAPTDYHSEKARDVKYQADLREMELAERRGQLIPLDAVTEEILEVSSIFASQIESISGRLANDLARCDDPAVVHETLFSEMRRIRVATAERLQRHARDLQDTADSIKDSRRAVAEDGRPVGG